MQESREGAACLNHKILSRGGAEIHNAGQGGRPQYSKEDSRRYSTLGLEIGIVQLSLLQMHTMK